MNHDTENIKQLRRIIDRVSNDISTEYEVRNEIIKGIQNRIYELQIELWIQADLINRYDECQYLYDQEGNK